MSRLILVRPEFPVMMRRAAVCWLMVMGVLGLMSAGCQTTPPGPAPTLADANDAYGRHDYATAYNLGRTIAAEEGGDRYDAAYLAGLSAQALGRPNAARDLLIQATHSRRDQLAGDAGAALGLLFAQHGQYANSATALLRAAKRLRGEDRAHAFFYAAVAQQKLGRWPQARTNLILARSFTRDRGFRQQVTGQLRVTGYTVQVGAFQDESNAQTLAEQLADTPYAQRYGDPRIVAGHSDRGRSLSLVQIGHFATFDHANRVRTQLGQDSAIVVPLAQ